MTILIEAADITGYWVSSESIIKYIDKKEEKCKVMVLENRDCTIEKDAKYNNYKKHHVIVIMKNMAMKRTR